MEVQGLRPCMVAPTKIIAGLGISLGIDILEAPGTTGDYRTLLTNKATAIAKALAAPLTTHQTFSSLVKKKANLDMQVVMTSDSCMSRYNKTFQIILFLLIVEFQTVAVT